MGQQDFGVDPECLNRLCHELGPLVASGMQVGLVVGGGNLFRGAQLSASGVDRVTGDHVGMLATVINALTLSDALQKSGVANLIMSAIPMQGIVGGYDSRQAIEQLEQGRVVIFAGGTGNPFFTTDSAACLRAIEIKASAMFKATQVDGVYSADPLLVPGARRYQALSYDEVLEKQLGVMDLPAVCLAKDHDLPVHVFAMGKAGALERAVTGGDEGTLIAGREILGLQDSRKNAS